MAECFCCGEPVTEEWYLEWGCKQKPNTQKVTIFCEKCKTRLGKHVRFMRRVMRTGTVVEG